MRNLVLACTALMICGSWAHVASADTVYDEGQLCGTVKAKDGTRLDGIEITVWDPQTVSNPEIEATEPQTTTDDNGNYCFSYAQLTETTGDNGILPSRVHVTAVDPAGNQAPGWRWRRWVRKNRRHPERSKTTVNMTLRSARKARVSVVDGNDQPLAGVFVIAMNPRAGALGHEVGAVDFGTTDEGGYIELDSTRRAHIWAFEADEDGNPDPTAHLGHYLWRQKVGNSGSDFTIKMPSGTPFTLSVKDTEGAAIGDGVYVGLRAFDQATRRWYFQGYHYVDAAGQLKSIIGKYGYAWSWDRKNRYIQGRSFFRSQDVTDGAHTLTMALGKEMRLSLLADEDDYAIALTNAGEDEEVGQEVTGYVRAYCHLTRGWSRSYWTGSDGIADIKVCDLYSLFAWPDRRREDDSFLPAREFMQSYDENDTDHTLEMRMAQEATVTVADEDTLKGIDDVRVVFYGDGKSYSQSSWTDEDGLTTGLLPLSGTTKFRTWSKDPAYRGWKTHDLVDTGSDVVLTRKGLNQVSGTVMDLAGNSVTDETFRIYTWNARTRRFTGRTETDGNGNFTVPVADYYHLYARPRVWRNSRYMPVYHRFNTYNPDTGTHAREIRSTRGYFLDVAAVDQNGDGVKNVGVHAGFRWVFSGCDGIARNVLARPYFHLRNWTRRVGGGKLVLPARNRYRQTIDHDHTIGTEGSVYHTFVLSSTDATRVSGRVVGPKKGHSGKIRKLKNMRVDSYGARRHLGRAYTDRKGRFDLLAAANTDGFTTTVRVRPHRRDQAYLPEQLTRLSLDVDPTNNDQGDITLDGAAWASGKVVDPFGSTIDDGKVRFWTRRMDQHPRWHIGGGRVGKNGEFRTKVAPKTWFQFVSPAWNSTYERKRFTEEFDYSVGQKIKLGEVEIGRASSLTIRVLGETKDESGENAPLPGVRVVARDASDGRAYDWARSRSDGTLQLRVPMNQDVYLQYAYYYWPSELNGSSKYTVKTTSTFQVQEMIVDFGSIILGEETDELSGKMQELLKIITDESRKNSWDVAGQEICRWLLESAHVSLIALDKEMSKSEKDATIMADLSEKAAFYLTMFQQQVPAAVVTPEETIGDQLVSGTSVIINQLGTIMAATN